MPPRITAVICCYLWAGTARAEPWLHLDLSASGGYDDNIFLDANRPHDRSVRTPRADLTEIATGTFEADLVSESIDRVELRYEPLLVNFADPFNGWITDHLATLSFTKALSKRVATVFDLGGEFYDIAAFREDLFLLARGALGLRYRGDNFSLLAQYGAGFRSYPRRTISAHSEKHQLDLESAPSVEGRWNIFSSFAIFASYRFLLRSSDNIIQLQKQTLHPLDGWEHGGTVAAALDLPWSLSITGGVFAALRALPGFPSAGGGGSTFVGRNDVARGAIATLRWGALRPFALRLNATTFLNTSDDAAAIFNKTTLSFGVEYAWDGGNAKARRSMSEGASTLAPEQTPEGWRFAVLATGAREVYLVGSFNHWSRHASPMPCDAAGLCTAVLPLSPGHYRYLFLVDGTWVSPEGAAGSADEGFGKENGLLEVPATENSLTER